MALSRREGVHFNFLGDLGPSPARGLAVTERSLAGAPDSVDFNLIRAPA